GWGGRGVLGGVRFGGVGLFGFGHDSAAMRIAIYSTGQIVPLALPLRLLMSREDGRINYGARLTGIIALLIIAIYVFRVVAKVFLIGGDFSFVQFNTPQSIVILALMF